MGSGTITVLAAHCYRIVLFHTRINHMKQVSTILRQSKLTWLNKGHIIAHIMIPERSRITTKITHNAPLYEVNPLIVSNENDNNIYTTTDQQRATYHNCFGRPLSQVYKGGPLLGVVYNRLGIYSLWVLVLSLFWPPNVMYCILLHRC